MFRLIMAIGSISALLTSASLHAKESPTVIKVASDPSAAYRLLSLSKMANGNLQVTTGRVGRSGTSFARREVNCRAMTFRYLGEGDTLTQAMRNAPNRGRMTEAMSTSISGEVSRFACKRGR